MKHFTPRTILYNLMRFEFAFKALNIFLKLFILFFFALVLNLKLLKLLLKHFFLALVLTLKLLKLLKPLLQSPNPRFIIVFYGLIRRRQCNTVHFRFIPTTFIVLLELRCLLWSVISMSSTVPLKLHRARVIWLSLAVFISLLQSGCFCLIRSVACSS